MKPQRSDSNDLFRQFSKPPRSSERAYRLVTVAAIGAVLGMGLCGASIRFEDNRFAFVFAIGGGAIFWISALLLIVGLIWLLVASYMN